MGQPKLLVFGGNGFVGSRVCEEALKTGLDVVSISRSGRPKLSADWVSSMEWVQVQEVHEHIPRYSDHMKSDLHRQSSVIRCIALCCPCPSYLGCFVRPKVHQQLVC